MPVNTVSFPATAVKEKAPSTERYTRRKNGYYQIDLRYKDPETGESKRKRPSMAKRKPRR